MKNFDISSWNLRNVSDEEYTDDFLQNPTELIKIFLTLFGLMREQIY